MTLTPAPGAREVRRSPLRISTASIANSNSVCSLVNQGRSQANQGLIGLSDELSGLVPWVTSTRRYWLLALVLHRTMQMCLRKASEALSPATSPAWHTSVQNLTQ